jgi:predicted dehydrogenase
VTFNEGVHHIDLWRFLLQQEIEEIFAFHAPSATYEDETSVLSARLSAGTLATAVNTFRTSPSSEIEIFGSEGRLSICLYRFDGLRLYACSEYPGSLTARIKGLSRTMIDLAAACPAMVRGGDFGDTFYQAWSHFIDSISSGEPPECSFADGRQAVLASLAAIQSFETGQPVAVAQDNL